MMSKISSFFSNNRRFLPFSVTAVLAFVAYGVGAISYRGMRDPQVFLNLFRNSPFLLISAVGMTLVIISGGIDLSVSGVVALTTVAAAALLREGWNVWGVMLLMLLMGMALGAVMGGFITYMKVQPFIATLAGMWFARGMCFFISDDAIAINNRTYRILQQTKILIPGLSNPAKKTGEFISILVIVSFIVLLVAIYIAHYTRFGRTVYAMGGNEQSARLMGLPVNRTKVLVYTLNGFCSALAGIALSIDVSSGHGLYATGFELTVIAAVVMGGTMLTGGVGYVFGTLFGVMVLGVTQTLIQFNGKLSSWWTNIVVGILTLVFIGVQSLLSSQQGRRLAVKKASAQGKVGVLGRWKLMKPLNRVLLVAGSLGTIAVIVLVGVLILNRPQKVSSVPGSDNLQPTSASHCQLQPFRLGEAEDLMKDGAVLAYERNGGPSCIDELYGVYPDGRIVGNDGTEQIEKQVTTADVEKLLSDIAAKGWFTDEMYNSWHNPCGQCYGYYLTVSYQGQERTLKAVDGGTDAPADYWQVVSIINGVIPKFTSAP